MRPDRIPLPVSHELYAQAMAIAGGKQVTARILFERAVNAAIRAERERIEAAHRAEVSRQRRRFGWAW